MFFFLGKYTARESHIDLNNDFINHGTLVAGIIKLKGPDNVEILNYKVKVMIVIPLVRDSAKIVGTNVYNSVFFVLLDLV